VWGAVAVNRCVIAVLALYAATGALHSEQRSCAKLTSGNGLRALSWRFNQSIKSSVRGMIAASSDHAEFNRKTLYVNSL
jgi:hypothetical protein